jgi:hypothetical protein
MYIIGAAPHFETSSHAYKAAGEINLAHMMMVQSANRLYIHIYVYIYVIIHMFTFIHKLKYCMQ